MTCSRSQTLAVPQGLSEIENCTRVLRRLIPIATWHKLDKVGSRIIGACLVEESCTKPKSQKSLSQRENRSPLGLVVRGIGVPKEIGEGISKGKGTTTGMERKESDRFVRCGITWCRRAGTNI